LPVLIALVAASPGHADSGRGDIAAYVRARAADADGVQDQAAQGYAVVLAAHPADAALATRAYRAALLSGDTALERQARLVLQAAGVAPSDSWLLAIADAVGNHDDAGFARAMEALSKGPFDFILPSLRAWQLFPTDPKGAFAALDGAGRNPLAARFANENRALLLIADGRAEEGVVLIRLLGGMDGGDAGGSIDLRVAGAQLLARLGKTDQALALLAGSDPRLAAYRASLGQGVRATTAFGIARLYVRLADNLDEGKAALAAVTLARAALRLEPDNDNARLALAAALTTSNALAQANAALDPIAPSSPVIREAQALRVAVLDANKQSEQALAAARTLADSPLATSEDAQRYGDLLAAGNRFDDAANAYSRAIHLAANAADWTLYLQQGGALDRGGHWNAARQALERAVALAPSSPVALNYLGYAKLEHREDPRAAAKLLERAVGLKPDDNGILDSLAWAYFLQGDVVRALPMLERAAQGEPANATINEHLGDAYWASGRYYEARYAWQAARLTADSGDRERLMAKLADGLSRKAEKR
jgi:Flp pilus assembly protein TadD